MNRETIVPSIPDIRSDNAPEVLRAIKNILDVREARIGDPLDQVVTMRDLKDIGLVEGGGSSTLTSGASVPVAVPGATPGGYNPATDYTTPPAPTDLTANGGFSNVYLSWGGATFRNPAYTEVWRATTDNLGDAVKIGTSSTGLYADAAQEATTYYYWVRFVSLANIAGPFNSTRGTSATTATNPSAVLTLLTGQITESQLYQTLGARIDLIDGDEYMAGSVASRIAAEALSRTNAINSLSADLQTESMTRAAEIQNEAALRANAIFDEASARNTAISALQSQVNTIVAAGSSDTATILAALQSEQTARINADAAEATARETIATQMRGNYLGTDPSMLSTGILYNERQARITAEGLIASSVASLSATVNSNYLSLSSAITSEQNARISGDSAITSSITTLSATVGGKNQTFYLSTPPTANAVGDLWFDSANNNKAYRWNGSSWVPTDDTRIAANAAAIVTEQTVRANADNALTSSVNALSSTINTNYNTLNSAITSEAMTRASANTALSNSINALTATVSTKNQTFYSSTQPTATSVGDLWFDSANGNKAYRWSGSAWTATDDTRIAANASAIVVEQTARANADTALTNTVNTLTSTVTGNFNTLNASIQSEASTRASADSALSSTINTVSAIANAKNTSYFQSTAPSTGLVTGDIWYDSANGNKAYRWSGTAWVTTQDTAITANAAAIVTEQNARTSADSSLATSISSLSSTVTNNYNTLNSALQNNYYTKTQTDSAISSATTTLQSTINNQLTGYATSVSLQTEATTRANADGALQAQYTVKIDNNGHVSGFGLASGSVNGTPTSAFIVRADRFAIAGPNDNSDPLGTLSPSRLPFIVTTTPTYVNGRYYGPGTWIDTAFIANATIGTAQISDLTADKITTGTLTASIGINTGQIYGGVNPFTGWQPGSAYFGTGFFLGNWGGYQQFYVGSPSKYMLWNGTDLTVRGVVYASAGSFTGSIYAASGTIGGNTIDSSAVSSPGYVSGSAGWRLNSSGSVEFQDATVRGVIRSTDGKFVIDAVNKYIRIEV